MLTPLLVLFFGPLVVGAVFLACIFGLGQAAGWHELAKRYPGASRADPPRASTRSGGSGVFNGANLKGFLIVGGDAYGLHLRAYPPFSLVLDAIFVPWKDLSIETEAGVPGEY